jgi:signal transduction histidine kinase
MIQTTDKIDSVSSIQTDVENVSRIGIIPSLLDVICRTTGMGFAAVARVTEDKWVACSVKDEISFGLQPGGELKLETTICNEIRQHHQPVVIDHVDQDTNFVNHHTPLMYGFQSYISIPIMRKDGGFFGTLCAIDPKPHKLNTPEIINMFTLFADLISFHLQAIEKISTVELNLQEEKETSDLRDQFIAILGHDLRNPLSAISFSSELLHEMPLEEEASSLIAIIKKSAARMAQLIKNTLDFARGKMGGGIMLDRTGNEPLEQILNHIVSEQKTARPEAIIETRFNLKDPVYCDGNRIGELLSNLLGNAIAYGDADAPIQVRAKTHEGRFILSVSNKGNEIPAESIGNLFKPFVRGENKSDKKGLGLGLYIASEIARAHEGRIDVISDAGETSFILNMPIMVDG